MGVDLNAFVERRCPLGWEMCPPQPGSCAPFFVPPCIGESRDKLLFAILGAYPWCEGIEPIRPARGLPADLSAEGRAKAEPRAGQPGYVGFTWLLLSELLAFPWSAKQHSDEFGTRSYAEIGRYFLADTIPALQALGPPDDIRMVMWVDY